MDGIFKEEIDMYDVLNMDMNSSTRDLKGELRKRLMTVHPDTRDKNLSERENERYDELTKLYNKINIILQNEESRKKYDEWYSKHFYITNYKEKKENNTESKENNKNDENNEKTTNNEQNNKTENNTNTSATAYSSSISLDSYKKFANDRIDNMPFNDDVKTYLKTRVNNANSINEVRTILADARKQKEGLAPVNITENKDMIIPENNKRKYTEPTINFEEPKKELPPPQKVVEQQPSWWSRNKKKVLIGAGIAAIAIVAAPYIAMPLMYMNSVAWHFIPALQPVFHGINVALGAVGSISPFATLSYSAALGEWALNGAIFNAAAISGSVLDVVGALTGDAVLGVGAGALIKKGYKTLSKAIKENKNNKKEKREKNKSSEKENFKNKTNSKIEELKQKYNESKQYRKAKKQDKQENRKNGFINKFKNINDKIDAFINKQELDEYKIDQMEWINKYTTDIPDELIHPILDKIEKAKTFDEINNIIDNSIIIKLATKDKKELDELDNYKTSALNTIINQEIDSKLLKEVVDKIEQAKTKEEVNKIINNNSQILESMKKQYCQSLFDKNLRMEELTTIINKIRNCSTLEEFKIVRKEISEYLEKSNNNTNEKQEGYQRGAA